MYPSKSDLETGYSLGRIESNIFGGAPTRSRTCLHFVSGNARSLMDMLRGGGKLRRNRQVHIVCMTWDHCWSLAPPIVLLGGMARELLLFTSVAGSAARYSKRCGRKTHMWATTRWRQHIIVLLTRFYDTGKWQYAEPCQHEAELMSGWNVGNIEFPGKDLLLFKPLAGDLFIGAAQSRRRDRRSHSELSEDILKEISCASAFSCCEYRGAGQHRKQWRQ